MALWGGDMTRAKWERLQETGYQTRDVPLGTDERLEAAIDEVGRDKVFARARSLGWSQHDSIPKFVWWGIVTDIGEKPASAFK